MAVLNFSTLSSLRSCAASFPLFSSLNTTCLQSSLADGRFARSGCSSNWGSTFLIIIIIVIKSNYSVILKWQETGDLQQGSKWGRQLLWKPRDLPLSQAVPLNSILRQRSSPGRQQHRQAQSKDVCLGQVAVVLKNRNGEINKRGKETKGFQIPSPLAFEKFRKLSLHLMVRGQNHLFQAWSHKGSYCYFASEYFLGNIRKC